MQSTSYCNVLLLANVHKANHRTTYKLFKQKVDSFFYLQELVHESMHDLIPGNIYFRFNPYLDEYLPLDEIRHEKVSHFDI